MPPRYLYDPNVMRISYSLVTFAWCIGSAVAAAIPYRRVGDAIVVLEGTLFWCFTPPCGESDDGTNRSRR